MSVKTPEYPKTIWDGLSDNPSRNSREDDINPDFEDYDRLVAEIIKMQQNKGLGPIAIGGPDFNIKESKKHQFVLTQNETLTVSNVEEGDIFFIKLIQDATGSRTVTWFSGISWAEGGTEPVLTTTANKADTLIFIAKSPTTFDGFILGQNI